MSEPTTPGADHIPHRFGSFADLAKDIAAHLRKNTLIDGEIVAVDRRGKPRFNDLLFHRRPPCFFAFDLLMLEGLDYRTHQLTERKQELRRLLAPVPHECPLRYVDHVDGSGIALFEKVLQAGFGRHRCEVQVRALCGRSGAEHVDQDSEPSIFSEGRTRRTI